MKLCIITSSFGLWRVPPPINNGNPASTQSCSCTRKDALHDNHRHRHFAVSSLVSRL